MQTATGLSKADYPSTAEGLYDPFLTNLSIAHDETLADELSSTVFPTLPVQLRSGQYFKWPRGAFLRDQMRLRGLGKEPELAAGWEVSKDTFYCEEWALADVIDDRQRSVVAPVGDELEQASVRMLTNAAIIRRERDWIDSFFKTGVWNYERTGVTTVTDPNTQVLQITESSVNSIRYFDDLLDNFELESGHRPNVAVLGPDVFRAIVHDPEYIERVKYTTGGLPGDTSNRRRIVAAVLGLDRVVVPRQVWNVAKEGLPNQLELIVPRKDMGLFYSPTTPGLKTESAGYRFAWTGLVPEEAGTGQFFSNRIERDRLKRAKSDWFGIYTAFDHKVVASDLGVFLRNIVA